MQHPALRIKLIKVLIKFRLTISIRQIFVVKEMNEMYIVEIDTILLYINVGSTELALSVSRVVVQSTNNICPISILIGFSSLKFDTATLAGISALYCACRRNVLTDSALKWSKHWILYLH